MKKVEIGAAIVKDVNEKLVNQLIETEQQCRADAQYSRRKCFEVVGIPPSKPKDPLEANISKVFDKLVHIDRKGIQACHRLKDNDRANIKLSNKKQPSGSSCQERPQIFGPDRIRLSCGHEDLYK